VKGQHGHLDCHGGEDEEVVAGEPGALRVEEVGADQQGKQERTEQARPALLDAEANELVERVRGGAALGPVPDPRLGLDEARQRCPDAGGAIRAGNRRLGTSRNAGQSTLHASLDAYTIAPAGFGTTTVCLWLVRGAGREIPRCHPGPCARDPSIN
jgi:hypothetical protein